MPMDAAVLDDIIGRLLVAKGVQAAKSARVTDAEIRQLCVASKEIFVRQPNLLELEAPIKICGKIRKRFDFRCAFVFGVVFSGRKLCLFGSCAFEVEHRSSLGLAIR